MRKKSDTKWKEFKVKKHKIGTYDVNKTSLSCFDDKRYILNDGITTLAYFHKDLIGDHRRCQKIFRYSKRS